MRRNILTALTLVLSTTVFAGGRTFHLDGKTGRDGQDGLTPKTAWKSLDKVNQVTLEPGDTVLLKRDGVYPGHLVLKAPGTQALPVRVDAYGEGALPRIESAGYLAGIHVLDSTWLTVANLEITSDGKEAVEEGADKTRYGVFVNPKGEDTAGPLTFRGLSIHDIFSTKQIRLNDGGKNKTSNPAVGIKIQVGAKGLLDGLLAENCRIERTGFIGLAIHGGGVEASGVYSIRNIRVIGNTLKQIGGPGIQPSKVSNMLVQSNTVDGSGSDVDERMHGRGSGIWPWSSTDVLIEKNRFMHARGTGDSCGAHIDFHCRNVVVQYNLSVDNEGGFAEVLGNNYNCAYRYNISINDGWRRKGPGKMQEGKTLFLSGFAGNKRVGPFNTYIYNNTIYVKEDLRTCFTIAPTTEGALFANNLLVHLGTTVAVAGDQPIQDDGNVANQVLENVRFRNNLCNRADVIPRLLPILMDGTQSGNPDFTRAGGFEPEDYIPRNTALILGRGIPIERLPGDDIGLVMGLAVTRDFLGNPVPSIPSLGAIEPRVERK